MSKIILFIHFFCFFDRVVGSVCVPECLCATVSVCVCICVCMYDGHCHRLCIYMHKSVEQCHFQAEQAIATVVTTKLASILKMY